MKTSMYIAIAAGAMAAATPVSAETYHFTRDGIQFDVEETVRDGVRLITGKDSSGADFSFRVRGARVTGTYRGQAMDFTVPARKAEKIAAR